MLLKNMNTFSYWTWYIKSWNINFALIFDWFLVKSYIYCQLVALPKSKSWMIWEHRKQAEKMTFEIRASNEIWFLFTYLVCTPSVVSVWVCVCACLALLRFSVHCRCVCGSVYMVGWLYVRRVIWLNRHFIKWNTKFNLNFMSINRLQAHFSV